MKTLVIGSAILDMILQVEQVPKSGEDIFAQNPNTRIGGCAYNVASTLSNLGCEHDLCVPIGEGMCADRIKEELVRKGYPLLIQEVGQDNGFCLCMVDKYGERTFVTVQGVEGRFESRWLKQIPIQEYDNIYLSGYQVCGEGAYIIVDWLENVRGGSIYFAPGPVICKIEPTILNQIFKLRPILHLNEKELLDYTQASSLEEGVKTLYEKTQNKMIVTLGANGAIYWDGKQLLQIPSMQANVVDTIGAGDSHIGAILGYTSKGIGMEESIRNANKVAAGVVGIQGSIMEKEEFEKWMEE